MISCSSGKSDPDPMVRHPSDRGERGRMREFYAGWFMWAAEVQTGRDRDMDRHKECRERESQ